MLLKKELLIILLGLCATFMQAQTVADFENLSLGAESFLDGSDGSGGFNSGNIFLNNDYNTTYGSWSGWAISNTTDVTTPGFGNQYSAVAGGGAEGSSNYALTFIFGESILALQGDAIGEAVGGIYVTNNTYAYLSMLEGDAFAKQFGGPTGNDPDYFKLTIKKSLNGVLSTDSIDFYLADYRFADNSEDYIIDDWTFVDLTSLGAADAIHFSLSSTDVGQFGMNTPGYFCLDNVTTSDGVSSATNVENVFDYKVFPNPATDVIYVDQVTESTVCAIYDLYGTLVDRVVLNENLARVDVASLAAGSYLMKLENEKGVASRLFVKH